MPAVSTLTDHTLTNTQTHGKTARKREAFQLQSVAVIGPVIIWDEALMKCLQLFYIYIYVDIPGGKTSYFDNGDSYTWDAVICC